MSFNATIDRRGTWSLKWDNGKNTAGKPDILPFWVADMDFPAPEGVLEAIRARADHPVFGYTNAPAEYFQELAGWYAGRYDARVPPECFLLSQAIMPSIGAAISAFSREGEGVIVMPPVYFPFFDIIRDNARVSVEAPLSRISDGRWVFDTNGLEQAVDRAARAGTRARILLLSSPHNPVARVWTRDELDAILEFTQRHGLTLISDEVHCDILFPPNHFVSLAGIEGKRAARIVVLAGPNKTFNLAGLHLSHVIARDEETRLAMKRALKASGFSLPNVFSMTAALAAYRTGSTWLTEVLAYIKGNYVFLRERIARDIPLAIVSPLEGTYLAWVHCSSLIARLGLDGDRALAAYLEDTGRVKFSAGSVFGTGGEGHVRINIACPRAQLAEGIERAAGAIQALLGER